MQVSSQHAHIKRKENGEYFVADSGSERGTWLNDKQLKPNQEVKLHPEDKLYFGSKSPECCFKVKLAHESVESQLKSYIKQAEQSKAKQSQADGSEHSGSQQLAGAAR